MCHNSTLDASIIFTVTNDLTYDQRMGRICRTLGEAGYRVELVGRLRPNSVDLDKTSYRQTRLRCRFDKGFAFYAEYNIRLFFYLLRADFDAVGTVDFDTLPAGCAASVLRRKKRVFDAHEYFTEVPEVTHRPIVKAFWAAVGRFCLVFYRHAYTVGPALAEIFSRKYRIPFGVVRNTPELQPEMASFLPPEEKILLYQGALNEGRGIECLIDAMPELPGFRLYLAGEGDLSAELRRRVSEKQLDDRVVFCGFVKPADLKALTLKSWLGFNLLENRGLSYYYSLANKFFDFIQAGIPVVTMRFPEYEAMNRAFETAVLLDRLEVEDIVQTVRLLASDEILYRGLQRNCLAARTEWNWQTDKKRLLEVWEEVFRSP